MVTASIKTIELYINPKGELVFKHSDELALAFKDLGPRTDKRVSQVDPYENQPGTWVADMAPIVGRTCLLGPFTTRSAALEAEDVFISQFLSGTLDLDYD